MRSTAMREHACKVCGADDGVEALWACREIPCTWLGWWLDLPPQERERILQGPAYRAPKPLPPSPRRPLAGPAPDTLLTDEKAARKARRRAKQLRFWGWSES